MKRLHVCPFLCYKLLRHVHISLRYGNNGGILSKCIRCCKLCWFLTRDSGGRHPCSSGWTASPCCSNASGVSFLLISWAAHQELYPDFTLFNFLITAHPIGSLSHAGGGWCQPHENAPAKKQGLSGECWFVWSIAVWCFLAGICVLYKVKERIIHI